MEQISTADFVRKQLLAAAVAATCIGPTTVQASDHPPFDRHLRSASSTLKKSVRSAGTANYYETIPGGYIAYETGGEPPSQPASLRQTSEREHIIGELRRWQSLSANWDGEGARTPNINSLSNASSFVCALDDALWMPEPMLLSSGNAGLYWRNDELYADLEFLGDGRVAYYIENGRNRHKGVVEFDSVNIPPVFKTLIWT